MGLLIGISIILSDGSNTVLHSISMLVIVVQIIIPERLLIEKLIMSYLRLIYGFILLSWFNSDDPI